MTSQFATQLSDLLASMVRCVLSHAGSSLPALPPWIVPEQKAAEFALNHPEEAERMVNELYTLLQNYVSKRWSSHRGST